jgi:hypothetical protein
MIHTHMWGSPLFEISGSATSWCVKGGQQHLHAFLIDESVHTTTLTMQYGCLLTPRYTVMIIAHRLHVRRMNIQYYTEYSYSCIHRWSVTAIQIITQTYRPGIVYSYTRNNTSQSWLSSWVLGGNDLPRFLDRVDLDLLVDVNTVI